MALGVLTQLKTIRFLIPVVNDVLVSLVRHLQQVDGLFWEPQSQAFMSRARNSRVTSRSGICVVGWLGRLSIGS